MHRLPMVVSLLEKDVAFQEQNLSLAALWMDNGVLNTNTAFLIHLVA